MTMTMLTDHDTIFVGGEWVPSHSTERTDVVSPWSQDVIASVPSSARQDIDVAVGAARQALTDGPWPRMSLEDRIAILGRLRNRLVNHGEELAQLITDEMGC